MFVSNYFKLAINLKLPASKHISLPLCKLYVSLHFLSTQCINFASTNLFNIDFKKLSRVYEAILLMHLRTKKVSEIRSVKTQTRLEFLMRSALPTYALGNIEKIDFTVDTRHEAC